ncbi:hypothetical protein JZU68_09685, partial [bacterium]|nr:hypothetical protein [bacterium]
NMRPNDIPINPRGVYKNKGWKDVGDWLGTGHIANRNMVYRPFKEARKFVRNLKLRNVNEWNLWRKKKDRPLDIPTNPNSVYKSEGWISWGDWLETKNRRGDYLPFSDARNYVHLLGLSDQQDWRTWAKSEKRPYKNSGWISWGDWLGTKNIANQKRVHRQFEEARMFVRQLGLKNQSDWRKWTSTNVLPKDIPLRPDSAYQSLGWISWGDWLGVVNLWNRNAVLHFLNGIQPILKELKPAELYAIMRQNGMIASSRTEHKTAPLIKDIRDLCFSPTPE